MAPTSSTGELKARVRLTPAGRGSLDASLLLLLGAHLVLLTAEEEAAAGTTAGG